MLLVYILCCLAGPRPLSHCSQGFFRQSQMSAVMCLHLSVQHLMKHINLLPLDSHGVDFSRVRMLNLNNWSKYYRQTLLFSALQDPQINSVFNKHCFNYVGQVSSQRSWNAGVRGGEEGKTQHVEKCCNSVGERLCACNFPHPNASVWISVTLHTVPEAWGTAPHAVMLIWYFSFTVAAASCQKLNLGFFSWQTQVILFYLLCC